VIKLQDLIAPRVRVDLRIFLKKFATIHYLKEYAHELNFEVGIAKEAERYIDLASRGLLAT
jgi:hypothetical protein